MTVAPTWVNELVGGLVNAGVQGELDRGQLTGQEPLVLPVSDLTQRLDVHKKELLQGHVCVCVCVCVRVCVLNHDRIKSKLGSSSRQFCRGVQSKPSPVYPYKAINGTH